MLLKVRTKLGEPRVLELHRTLTRDTETVHVVAFVGRRDQARVSKSDRGEDVLRRCRSAWHNFATQVT